MTKTLLATFSRMWKLSVGLPRVHMLAFTLAALTYTANAQVSVFVQEPASGAASFTFTTADFGAEVATMDPVIGYLTVVDDGTAADSLGCNTLVNANEMAGRIALVYRGACFFSEKAYYAQTAGAIAVVIVNNVPGGPLGMTGADFATDVTIPVVMISDHDGAYLRNLMITDEVELFIGDLTGVFAHNLAIEPWGIMHPRAAGMPAILAMDPNDLVVSLGAAVLNYGSEVQSSVQLRGQITRDGMVVYDELSEPPITVGLEDTIYIVLPNFTQDPYAGRYEITYTIQSENVDQVIANNTLHTSLHIGEVFTYADVNPATGVPDAERYMLPADAPATGWRSCIFFNNPNASRAAATGLYVNVSADSAAALNGGFLVVQANSWTDPIANYVTLPSAMGLTEEIAGDHTLSAADFQQTIYVPFAEPLVLMDDANYLFCMISTDDQVRHGWNNTLEYDQNMLEYGLPISNINIGTLWYNQFTGVGTPPSIGVHMIDANTIGIHENEKIDITPFPNPTNDFIRIPLAGQSGTALLEIYNMAGAKVAERRVNVSGDDQLLVDMNGISNGTYMFNMMFDNGKRANFRVVVSR